ncbi:MAG TPA: cytochrome c oxidase subunit II [Gemmataceae bacterium]|nr:cytochrome c oxidase subunit II [Gemmataceae bacterium]
MFADNIVWFPPEASTTAHQVDWLFYFLVAVTGSVGLLVAFLLFYFSIRYRRRPGVAAPPSPATNLPLELFWTLTPLGVFMVIFVWGVTIYFDASRAPDDATVIYGQGKQWMWKFQHPEGQREINELHVPTGRPIKVVLTSEDVIHSFYVPDFRVHMDVLPERYTSVWFEPTVPGDYHLFCSQYCGTNHAGMIGWVHVMKPGDYQTWLNEHAEGSLALEGRKTFLKYRCVSCHGGEASQHARAPTLEDLYLSRVRLTNGETVLADEGYIRESVLNPGAKVVLGWQNLMPSFKGQVSEEEIVELIAYVKSLRGGQTPSRVEDFPPPADTPPITPRKEQP